ncbi:Solute carrier family 49 member 4-like 2 [Homarus americanus]|uniref:Solute carrier family 49 member 4-like 2 n=1 Tax=Homarus americanus TaxID=6706 RepID=A0A8J5N7G0_HOMAM|nr:Solute carrier family 49 member 4-like 2 [Homarus americanus]
MPGADDLQAIVPEAQLQLSIVVSATAQLQLSIVVSATAQLQLSIVVSATAQLQLSICAVWNTWGPITASVKLAYPNWDDAEIALLSILAHIGAVLNGFAGIIIGAAPSLISSRWFPARERTTATAAGLCIALFVGVVSYFPDKPHKPPSLTSFIRERPNPFVKDIKLLLSNKNIWLLVVPYSITLGINVAWSSVLDINLAPFDISQASWLGVYVTLGGVVMALLSARFSDLLFGYMKLTIIVLMTFATAGYTWFLLLMNGCLPYNKVELFISVISGASFNYACSPLFFELAVELAYPVPEGVVGAFLTMCWNIVAASFLLTMQTPLKSNVIWMDYLLAIQGLVVVCLMIFVREEYKRTTLDRITAGTDNQTNQSVDQEVQVQA